MKLIKLFLLSMLAMVLASCGGEGSGLPSQGGESNQLPAIISLQITPATVSIPVGFGQQYLAEALLEDGTIIDITDNPAAIWSSSDPSIAVIDNKGLATGVAPGNVVITVVGTANGKPFTATAQLEITNAIVTSLQVTPATESVPVGFAQQFTATAFLSDGRTLNVTDQSVLSWKSSNPSIATISSSGPDKGQATGISNGTVTITASGSANGNPFTATAQLDVTNAIVTSLEVTSAAGSVPVGLTKQFSATALLSDGRSLDVTEQAALTWTSSDTSIATISNSGADKGVAKGITEGTATITASGNANGMPFTATAQLDVTDAVVTSLQITPATESVPVGLSKQLTATVLLSDGRSLDVTSQAALTWSSSDPSVATINSSGADKGMVTGVLEGTVTITASGTAGATPFAATAQLDVTDAVVTSLQVTPATQSVLVDLSQQFIATALLSDGNSLDVTNDATLNWTSSDSNIAIISNDSPIKGKATGRGKGTTTITASGYTNGTTVTATAELNVNLGCSSTDTVTDSAGNIWTCPLSLTDARALGIPASALTESGQTYARLEWDASVLYCATLGGGYRLPSITEFTALFNEFGNMKTYAGWPTRFQYWTSIQIDAYESYAFDVSDGSFESPRTEVFGLCMLPKI